MTSVLIDVAWFAFRLGFGLTSLASVWATAVLKNGALWASDSEQEKIELASAQQNHWALDHQPLPGFRHAFFKTRLGTSLHYVTNASTDASTPKNVAIFIHGFPDSFLLWRHILQSPELQRDHTLIAVDLPGYGGSDSLPHYGTYEMLETIAEFILEMRMQYLYSNKKVVVVTHDWGAIIGARLASEASELADHWIIASATIPLLARSNAIAQWTLAKQMLHTWFRSPLNLRLLKTAFTAFAPIRSQFRRSFYIFCILLPRPFNNFFATFGNYWFLRIMHSLGKGKARKKENLVRRLDPKEAGEAMAMSAGPGTLQVEIETTGHNSLRYGESVRKRVRDRGMSEKIKIYRDGLLNGRWEKSLETTAALYDIATGPHPPSPGPLLGTYPDGYLKAHTTFMLGERDPAFDRQLAFNNAKEYLAGGGQVVLVKDAGHWLPLESGGRRVMVKTVLWALSADYYISPFSAMSDVKVMAEA